MVDVTRRAMLGITGGALGVSACTASPVAQETQDVYDVLAGNVSFDHGVASGDPLRDRVILWSRVTPGANAPAVIPVRYTVFNDDAERTVHDTGMTEAIQARDYTVKVDAGGLKPGTVYHYRFTVNTADGPVDSPTGRTRTTAARGDDTPVRLAIVSCSNWPFGYFNAYRDIAGRGDLDAVLHLGDYIYEYGPDGYGGATGQQLGRNHVPAAETVTLADYRARHAQYKSDPDLQAAHAAAPWLCTWDDHESTNDSHRTGAENHNPEAGEGDWTDRKQVAVQAYLEWMPVRDPERGALKESIYRTIQFGDVATVFCLETRLTGRSEEISWFKELAGKAPEEMPAIAQATLERVADPGRTQLGAEQESWLAEGLEASVRDGTSWQVLANQTIMARVKPPNFADMLTPEQVAAIDNPFAAQIVGFSQLGVPWNLDAWDGFPAARERLYAAARDAGARLVTVTGDTHTAWANTLHDGDGAVRGVEFGCTSVTSAGLGDIVPAPDMGPQFAAVNEDVAFHDPFGRGYTVVTLAPGTVNAEFVKLSTVASRDYTTETAAHYRTSHDGKTVSPLSEANRS